MFIPLALFALGLQSHASGSGQPLLGADEIMRRMAAHQARPPSTDPFAGPRGESTALRAKLGTLSPEQAAGEWLSLMRHWESAASKNAPNDPNVSDQWAEIMMAALPDPSTWPLIRAALSKLPGLALAGPSLGGIGIPACLTSGERAAAEVLDRLVP